ncbi:hypothetical protein BT63DRAFT_186713 [Microthyrium microscopicum]|uniref:Uncharacterized protein n=1 Tax=Microthyrium microscopicum TaxID=703497 RepID=A0A6A6UKJ1_9PEZI|nr:hypothetical protein BT63DRAFT_186713 [Microthyrium microscopicum]
MSRVQCQKLAGELKVSSTTERLISSQVRSLSLLMTASGIISIVLMFSSTELDLQTMHWLNSSSKLTIIVVSMISSLLKYPCYFAICTLNFHLTCLPSLVAGTVGSTGSAPGVVIMSVHRENFTLCSKPLSPHNHSTKSPKTKKQRKSTQPAGQTLRFPQLYLDVKVFNF